jgi:ribosomal protein S11
MELLHLATMLERVEHVATFVATQNAPVVLSCENANTIIVAAALEAARTTSLGVWLEVGAGYAASLAARDVATLSWLVSLDHVVVHGPDAPEQAQILTALLTNEQVTFVNDVASIKGAYNRPAPPRTVRVWHVEGEALRAGDEQLRAVGTRNTPAGACTTYVTA